MKDLNNNRIEELLPRYCEGRLSEGERLEVEAWMDESEENKRVATQTFALYLAVDTVQVMKKVDTEKALLKVKGKMSDREVRRTAWWEWAQRAAAILFIPLLTLLAELERGYRRGSGDDGSKDQSWNDNFVDITRWHNCLFEFRIFFVLSFSL